MDTLLITALAAFACAMLILPTLYVMVTEWHTPSERSREAGFSGRDQVLKIQQALSISGLLLLTLLPLTDNTPEITAVILWSVLLLLQIPQLWLRRVDLRRAVRSINWRVAIRRNQQIQALLLLQLTLSSLLLADSLTA